MAVLVSGFAAVVLLLVVTTVLLQAGRQLDGIVAWFDAR